MIPKSVCASAVFEISVTSELVQKLKTHVIVESPIFGEMQMVPASVCERPAGVSEHPGILK